MPVSSRRAFTLIELLVVIAIIAILAVVVVLTLNPAELLRQSRDSNRVSDMATLSDALNLYVTDQAGASTFSLGNASNTAISIYDPNASTTQGDQCQGLGMLSLNTLTGQAWQCSESSTLRNVNGTGWIPVNLSLISAGSPIGALPVDPTNQTSTGLFYAYNTNGNQFEVTANLESQKYKTQYGQSPQTSFFPEVISGGTQGISALYNNTGLVGYWPMDEGSGSSTFDQSGNGNNGAWTGNTCAGSTHYGPPKVGGSAGCFNSLSAVNLGDPSSLQAAAITAAAWVEKATTGNNTSIIANEASGDNTFYIVDSGTQGVLCRAYINSGGTAAGAITAAHAYGTIGVWYFVACTYNGNTITVYINGVAQATGTQAGSIYYGWGLPWVIGANGSTTIQNGWNGEIDDARIYNRALSAAEVMALYTAER